jgi:hypothetical protein
MLSQLNVAGIKDTARNRSWEQQHRGKSYRGIPKALHEALKEIAANHVRSVDVIAQAFLEYALVCCRRGELTFDPLLHQGRRTLLHTNGRVWDERSWMANPTSENTPRKRKATNDSWRRVATYRLSPEVIQTIHWFADQQEVPAGEIVTYLLSHALDAYQAGRLVIYPGT